MEATSKTSNPTPKTYPGWNWFEGLAIGLLALIGMDVLLGVVVGITLGIWSVAAHNPDLANSFDNASTMLNFLFYATSRLLGFGLIYWFLKRRGVSLKDFGFKKFKVGAAVARLVLAGVIFFVGSGIVLALVGSLFPHVNLDQAQDIVFDQATGAFGIGLAFTALVVIAPIVEESIFRGLMLPAFTKKLGTVPAVIITSALFGIVHMQLNVGILTFILGLLLAWLVIKSGSLWPAIILHSLKNLVAFIVIFHLF